MRRKSAFASLGAILLASVGAANGPATPTVEWLAFTGHPWSGGTDIELIALDGSGRVNLTRSRTLNQQHPSWSPDGRRIALDGGSLPNITIYTINADGSGLHRILAPKIRFPSWPTWSPNGRWIALLGRTETPYDREAVYLVRPDGSGLHEWWIPGRRFVTARGGAVPVWSPDGKRIAFSETVISRNRSGTKYDQLEIFVANADGSGLKRLTYSSKDDFAPAWSPDGTKIAFTSGRNRPAKWLDVYVMTLTVRSSRG